MVKTEEFQQEDYGIFSLDISVRNGRSAASLEEEIDLPSSGEYLQGLLALTAKHSAFEAQLLEEVRRHKPALGVACQKDCAVLAKILKSKGYNIQEHGPGTDRTCKKKGSFCLETISHNYLTCSGSSSHLCNEDLIIDPYFKEEFQIAHPSRQYAALLSALPAEYVGTGRKLVIIIELVSRAVAEAFKANEVPLPPWRKTTALLSKWNLKPEEDSDLDSEEETQRSRRLVWMKAKESASKLPGKENGKYSKMDLASINKPKQVSLLARGLAKMSSSKRKSECPVKHVRLRRAPSLDLWDFSGVPAIRVARNAGQVR